MSYSEIKNKCREGFTGKIPGWEGYLKWNYGIDQLQFTNKDYIMNQNELETKIKDRTDLYYII